MNSVSFMRPVLSSVQGEQAVYFDCNFVGGQRDLYRSTVPIIIIVPEMLFCCFNNKRR